MKKIYNTFDAFFGSPGRSLSSLKAKYMLDRPDDIIILNAGVFNQQGKIWHGDLNLTQELRIIEKYSEVTGEKVFVFSEKESNTKKEWPKIEKTILIIENGKSTFYIKNVEKKGNKWYYKSAKKPKDLFKRNNSVKYNVDDFKISVKIPMHKLLIGDPLEKLYSLVEKELSKMKIDLCKVDLFFSRKMYDKIEKIYKNYLIRKWKYKKDSEDMDLEMKWLMIDLPNIFADSFEGPKWSNNNTIYIVTKEMWG